MTLIIILISFVAASLIGFTSMVYLGNAAVGSEMTKVAYMSVIFIGLLIAALYELITWYSAYLKKHHAIPKGKVDHGALLIHQSMVTLVLAGALWTQNYYLVFFQTTVFLLTVISLEMSPYVLMYRLILRPLGMMKSDFRLDNIHAHQFAFSIGFTVSAIASYAFILDLPGYGWGLVSIIVVLGSLAIMGWCAGCFSYYLLNKMGFKGYFSSCPVDNRFIGLRPSRFASAQVNLVELD